MGYTRKTIVPYYDCDARSNMKISAVLREMQQAGSEHLAHIGLPHSKLYQEDMVFLLSKTCAKVHQMPKAAQKININTTPSHSRGARFVREALFTDEKDNPLVSILTLWVLVQPESRRILRPRSFPYPLPITDSILNGAVDDQKFAEIEQPKPFVEKDVEVGYSVVDNNSHVNNSSYADMVCDLMPYDKLLEKGIDEIMISYINEAKYGDTINIKGYQNRPGQYVFVGTKKDGDCFQAEILLNN